MYSVKNTSSENDQSHLGLNLHVWIWALNGATPTQEPSCWSSCILSNISTCFGLGLCSQRLAGYGSASRYLSGPVFYLFFFCFLGFFFCQFCIYNMVEPAGLLLSGGHS